MFHPTLEEFRELAKPGAVIPVYRDVLADLDTPVTAYMKVAKDRPYSFLLESVDHLKGVGQYSFLGADASIVFRAHKGHVRITSGDTEEEYSSRDPLSDLRKLMAQYDPVEVEGMPKFHGGAVGYIGYDHIRFIEDLPDKNEDPLDLPDLYFFVTDSILIFDHLSNHLKLVANAHLPNDPDAMNVDDVYNNACMKIVELEQRLERPLSVSTEKIRAGAVEEKPDSNFTKEEFCEKVEQAKEYIRAGDAFQIVLSQRFERAVYASPVNLYRALRSVNPSPYSILMRFPEFSLIGSSPEIMTQVKGRTCVVKPIAGTRPRGASKEEDNALKDELLADEKEMAEHIMLVDLGRNDVGRVSKPGTVTPTKQQQIEKYSHVMHIVSEVEGTLKDECDAFDALKATFPMGTVSGAPKIRAMEIIDELENLRRGPYAGGAGYIGFNGDMDTCIIIRTMIVKDGRVYIQAGAGIVYDSVPEKEYEETVNKAKACWRAVELAERGLET